MFRGCPCEAGAVQEVALLRQILFVKVVVVIVVVVSATAGVVVVAARSGEDVEPDVVVGHEGRELVEEEGRRGGAAGNVAV